MSFLHLAALWGLILLAVPLLLLLLRRKKLVLYWAAYEWLHATVVRKRREIEIRDLLKLISKLLLLAAIALLVARPTWRSSTSHGPLLLILDVSPSMGARMEEGSRLDRAKRLALELIEQHEGPVAVYTFSATLEPVVANYSREKGELRDRIARIALRSNAAGLVTMMDQLQACPCWDRADRVVVLGDFQNCWYGDGPEVERQMQRLGRGRPMSWVQVDDRPDVENAAITKMSLSPDGVWPGRPVLCDVDVKNGMSRETAPRILSVFVDGDEVARQPFRLAPLEQRTITATAVFRTAGRHNVEARLDQDALLSDNVRYGVVDVPQKLRVLAVVAPQGAAPFPWDTYVKRALASTMPEGVLDYRAISPTEFSSANLDGVDLVLGVNVPVPAGGPMATRLTPFLERGGGALLFLPGQKPDEASAFGLTGQISTNRSPVDAKKLNGTLLAFMQQPGLKAGAINITQTLVFEKIPDEAVRMRTLVGPVAVHAAVGRGVALVFGFIPYPEHGDLQFNPNFVQAMLRAVWYARNRSAMLADNGTTRDWHFPELVPDATYSLMGMQGEAYSLAIDGVGDAAKLVLPTTFPTGVYQIRENGKERARFGHNADVGDSLLEAVDKKTLAPAIKQGLVFGNERVLRQGGSRQLEWLAVLFLLAALLFEIYAHFLRKTK